MLFGSIRKVKAMKDLLLKDIIEGWIVPIVQTVFGGGGIGGELSKCEGVLFHWWPFSSKRNDELDTAVLHRYL